MAFSLHQMLPERVLLVGVKEEWLQLVNHLEVLYFISRGNSYVVNELFFLSMKDVHPQKKMKQIQTSAKIHNR